MLGDGDVMMRLLPSLLAVEAMRAGATPMEASHQVDKGCAKKMRTFLKFKLRGLC